MDLFLTGCLKFGEAAESIFPFGWFNVVAVDGKMRRLRRSTLCGGGKNETYSDKEKDILEVDFEGNKTLF